MDAPGAGNTSQTINIPSQPPVSKHVCMQGKGHNAVCTRVHMVVCCVGMDRPDTRQTHAHVRTRCCMNHRYGVLGVGSGGARHWQDAGMLL
jgi:hypothetical protein